MAIARNPGPLVYLRPNGGNWSALEPALAGALRPEWRWATIEPVDTYAEFTLAGYSVFSPVA